MVKRNVLYRGLFVEEAARLRFDEIVRKAKGRDRRTTNTIIFNKMMDAYEKYSQMNTNEEKESIAATV